MQEGVLIVANAYWIRQRPIYTTGVGNNHLSAWAISSSIMMVEWDFEKEQSGAVRAVFLPPPFS
jgi:hypothetical protein